VAIAALFGTTGRELPLGGSAACIGILNLAHPERSLADGRVIDGRSGEVRLVVDFLV
jgi:hypothetical protein